MNRVTFSVNGVERTLDVEPGERLLDVLRVRLGLTGTKEGCGIGTCGACTVLVDGRAENACLVPAASLDGARVVVVGRSLVIGKPVAMLALDRNATVSIAHSHTSDLAELTRGADIVIACVGHARLLDASYFAPGQAVLDVGINFVDGQMVGDVDTESAARVAGAITPVPGGVGAVTTSVMLRHVVTAAQRLS